MSNSIHTARWIGQIADLGWDIHLFPSIDYGDTHAELKNVTIYHSLYGTKKNKNPNVNYNGQPVFSNILAWAGRFLKQTLNPHYRRDDLIRVIKEIQPDIIHSMEFQHGGYLVLDAKREFLKRSRNNEKFPSWIATNWGSDIFLFGKMPDHKEKIQALLKECDYYSCECERDIELAKKFGFNGKYLPVLPNTGGFTPAFIEKPGAGRKTSDRRVILLKGYQGWAGRALVGLDAIELCAGDLQEYEVEIYSCTSPEVRKRAHMLSKKMKIPIRILPPVSHEDLLEHFGRARIYIGLSISDAISTALLESMVMGSFPIQSDTSCADEWITDGKTGFIVPPEDASLVASKLKQAVCDDQLVDTAAKINSMVAKDRLNYDVIKGKVISEYEKIFSENRYR
ncbi:glycosyltransferase family 4 protein [uncultured Methanoregula sp.]|uniref:glycosyltransferase family 4 protein n=1 Tax=uncultured Methanoregula sp. TaxID=1005933 RepID=UPI002D1E42CE|nr:glycosyltransferase family 4 protein [uncultured Methanoregula sp.]